MKIGEYEATVSRLEQTQKQHRDEFAALGSELKRWQGEVGGIVGGLRGRFLSRKMMVAAWGNVVGCLEGSGGSVGERYAVPKHCESITSKQVQTAQAKPPPQIHPAFF